MMTALEFQAERQIREMGQREFGRYLASIMRKDRAYTASEVSHWETGRRPVPAAVEAELLVKRWGWMGLQRVYVIGGDGGTIKIGRSMHPGWRCKQLRCDEKRRDLDVLFEAYCIDATHAEWLAHKHLSKDRDQGEWFKTTPLEAIAAVASAVYEVNTHTVTVFLTDEEVKLVDAVRGGMSRSDFIKRATLQALKLP